MTFQQTITLTLSADALESLAQRVVERRETTRPTDARDTWLTIPRAAAYIGAKPQRIYDLRSSGRLSRHADGARALVDRHELDELVTRGG